MAAADLQQQLASAEGRIRQLSVSERAHTESADQEKKRVLDVNKQMSQLLKQTQEANNQRI